MPNLMEMLRMANMFNPQSMNEPVINNPEFMMPTNRQSFENISFGSPELPNVQSMNQPMNQPMNPDIGSRMQELYNPSTVAGDRFEGLIDAYPERNEPGMLRKIASIGLASLSDLFGKGQGQQTFNDMMYPGFERKLTDWKTKIGPAQQAANLERQENVNTRTLAHQTVSNEIRAKSEEEKVRKNEADQKLKQQRADVYEFKAKNPHLKLTSAKGGNIMAFNSLTGETTDTGISSGSLSDSDKITLMGEQALERVSAQGEEARKTEGLRQEGRESISETRGWKVGTIPDPNDPSKQLGVQYNEITGEVKPIKIEGQNISSITKPGTTTTPQNISLQNIQSKTQETLQALDELLDEKGKLKNEIKTSIGGSRLFGLQHLPATEARAGDAKIKRLKSMLIVDLIGEMKAQSKTGATGFGQLNMKELAVLENAASKLDPALDEATFETELNRIREKLKKVLQPSDGLNPTVTPKKPTAAELIRKYGGQ